MKGKQVFVFGNPELPADSLPIRLLPSLRERFSDVSFLFLDPNEEWEPPDPLVVIDTVVGIRDVRIFEGIDVFTAAPTVSMHDFDALFNLRYLAKLGKLGRVIVIGVPPELSADAALPAVVSELEKILPD
ncbi:MAG: hypothetical protein A3C93_02370 [Candidatus Lloydbacteria bacterium RIFCSPHIGHO2_02_FULL_54_17]|uniref:Hydrogenase maturation protease n=1 Tax=Candidatus Lloydbacteria bacterium RIFCSPHIGHO2_02_FULL_54_17 TaxID=1798664 RepID=A0A1G2DG47_9BACT|nr:MAG: hypothetical protein A2762_04535 [Candidatus Lloydbacteria bacterium RIFCSPHIGHO2_01_FULL_54_11]OGZ11758.1 MAG: hypothetical protein A3C93_02370 [Candidatus Lloydbacteria bacterium RIFCSPHIGHO2_02_FULL_54_17]OGZ14287.1 MAG: hypothetical protein A2948_01705 [Candidatus Lloydbacteria bacterium RIFCSPLOWO2_01_FULL_54_18]OGZ16045.1 MAG: hypothetical protein A3H76_00780 [Candidatus Lloydbacteria bacterium RIFCSPLOWO2_02_FULL_54_12]